MQARVSLFAELKRRNVLRAGVLYAGVVWALAQGLAQLLPLFGDYGWIARWFVIAAIIGFPFWVAFAWFYEFTPQGLRRESEMAPGDSAARATGRKLDKWIIAVLLIAVVLLLTNTFVWRSGAGLKSDAASNRSNIPAKSIAVLPFVNMSGDPKNDYFSDGITEEILDALAQVPNLKVAARTSAFAFKGKAEDLRKVGEVLDVATVLEGSVQQSGDEVRITAQLIDTRSGYHLWSEKYDRKLTSIFAVEDEISKAIADKLQVRLAGGKGQSLEAQETVDPHAHDFYLRGLTLLAARSVAEAVVDFKQAVAIQPDYPQAWASLAEAQALLPDYGPDPAKIAYADSLKSAARALALDPNNALAHVAQGMVYSNQMRWPDADRALRRALALAPGDAEVLNQHAQFLEAVGQLEPALVELDRALQRDPLSGTSAAIRVQLRWNLHRDEATAAVAQIGTILQAHPDSVFVHRNATLIYLHLHRYPEAEAQTRVVAALTGADPEGMVRVIRGMADPALRVRAVQSLETASANSAVPRDAIVRALFLMHLDASDRALSELEQGATESGIPQLLWYPDFDPIRDDPRFKAVLKKMDLPYTPQKLDQP
jgi:TolB-like protein/lipoprotein NlpI